MNIKIRSKRIVLNLAFIGLLLCLISLAVQAIRYFSIFNIHPKVLLYLNVSGENNIPSLYSSTLLLLSAVLLCLISISENKSQRRFYWKTLSLIFFFLSADEMLQLHENINPILSNSFGFGTSTSGTGRWDAFSLSLFFLVGLIYCKFLISLPKQVKQMFLIAAIIFAIGGAGIEVVGINFFPSIYIEPTIFSGVLSTIEELLEMLGSCIFVFGLITYMECEVGSIKVDFLNSKVESQRKLVSGSSCNLK